MKTKILGDRRKNRLEELAKQANEDPMINEIIEGKTITRPVQSQNFQLEYLLQLNHDNPVTRVAFSDKDYVLCTYSHGEDCEQGKLTAFYFGDRISHNFNTHSIHLKGVKDVCNMPSPKQNVGGQVYMAILDDKGIDILRLKNGLDLDKVMLDFDISDFNNLAFSRDGTKAALGSDKGLIKILSSFYKYCPNELFSFQERNVGKITSLSFGKYDSFLAVANNAHATFLGIDYKHERLDDMHIRVKNIATINIAFSKDGKLVATSDEFGNTLRLWRFSKDADNTLMSGASTKLPGSIRGIDFSYDDKYMAVACEDCKAYIYEINRK